MNKRLLRLLNQAGFHQPEMERMGIEHKFEKFAELIVREVFAKIEYERFEIYQPVKDSVMKHFGVEE
jgi:hypothetical protein